MTTNGLGLGMRLLAEESDAGRFVQQAAARLPWFHVVGRFGQQAADPLPWFSRSTTLPEPLHTSLPSIQALEDELSRGLVGEAS